MRRMLARAPSDATAICWKVNGVPQTKKITWEQFGGTVPVCTFAAQSDLTVATNYQDLWWGHAGRHGSRVGHQSHPPR